MSNLPNSKPINHGAFFIFLLPIIPIVLIFGPHAGITAIAAVIGLMLAVEDYSMYAANARQWTTRILTATLVTALGAVVFSIAPPAISWVTQDRLTLELFPAWGVVVVAAVPVVYLLVSLALVPAARSRQRAASRT